METILIQIVTLFIISIPVACIAWTVTHEEIFREPREFCSKKSEECNTFLQRKLILKVTIFLLNSRSEDTTLRY